MRHNTMAQRTYCWTAVVIVLLVAGAWGCTVRIAPASVSPPLDPQSQLYIRVSEVLAGDADPAANQSLMEAYQHAGQDEPATAYMVLAARQTQDPVLWRQVAETYLAQGNWEDTRDALRAVLNINPDDALAHYQLGILLVPFDERNAYDHLAQAAMSPELHDRAVLLQTAIANTGSEDIAYRKVQLGIALSSLDVWPQAEQAFQLAVVLEPRYVEAWAYLGYARARQVKAAASEFERAAFLAPQSSLVMYLTGLASHAVGDYTAALAHLIDAQVIDPQNPAIAAALGETYRRMGDLVQAEQWLRAAVELSQNAPDYLNQLAFFYSEEGFNLSGNGLTTLREAIALQPNNMDLLAAYGWALFSSQEVTASQDILIQVLEVEPDNPRALFYLGVFYRYQMQVDRAVSLFEQVLSHPEPDGFDILARRMLEEIGN